LNHPHDLVGESTVQDFAGYIFCPSKYFVTYIEVSQDAHNIQ